ncbi:oxidoreductase, short-chain dehydrogenase/reductase family [Burkholderia gladioli]|uniref:SDR family oxidoreductase n=2 Tax=Burkholderia TaxID=32008 RepID=UPI00163F87AE|nr:SDR family oxidoreductase [Burkholderia gladioli]CAG9239175.1 oxidoreductase, short-chain dehydrogenase/reductase family [Burkholderia gladioli]
MKTILIVGATSAIATECARRWAGEGAALCLAGRRADRLGQIADDLRLRGAARVATLEFDANALDTHEAMLAAAERALGPIELALVAHGSLPEQAACERDAALAVREFSTNGLSTIALLTPLANRMAARGAGTIAVIASVAADRGRPSNYLYGAAKAAVVAFCEGLRARLAKSGVHVLVIKPGFVATPMTAHLQLPGPLVARPERVAADIVRAVARRRDAIYTPWFWAGVMCAIRWMPGFLFKRVSL